MSREDQMALAKVRLEEILTFFGINTKVAIEETDERVEFLVETEDSAHLIGHHGENLRALQYLINMMLRGRDSEELRVGIDIGGYKKARAEQVTAKAREQVGQVIETGQSLELPPMNPAERRLVHVVVGETEGVVSESVGEGPKRRVVIKPN
ncbi:MAG TPA: R3H domain-containing nucleic acid-binding protein [Candidatus Saccharimonadales bacterium]|nr:R3H domain-containing nucleic acid-binding protein [Candidatus Saccharimonadales bacterium]